VVTPLVHDNAKAKQKWLQAMTLAEAIETTRIHSVAGLTGDRTALVTTRPCRAPHHTISDEA
jgi:magnesium chelatase family protein